MKPLPLLTTAPAAQWSCLAAAAAQANDASSAPLGQCNGVTTKLRLLTTERRLTMLNRAFKSS